MYRFTALLFVFLIALSCAKKEVEYEPVKKVDAFALYQEAFQAFEKGDYYYAEKKFSEAELNFNVIEYSAKAYLWRAILFMALTFIQKH